MNDVEHLSIYIDRAPSDVYEYAIDPRNLPRWASGLANSEVEQDGGDWIVEASFGKVKVKFAERNTFGVMDHDVTLGSGVTMHNPMRVVPHGDGSEFIFTLIRRVGMSDEEFAQDRATIEKDLKTLKAILEGSALTR
jgi:carbon monoxide dehydrogenase subunit G